MSKGNIYFLGANPDFRILIDQIFARNEVSSSTLIIPYRIEFASFLRNGGRELQEVEVLFAKGELRTRNTSIKCSESIVFSNHSLSRSQLSLESQFQFSITPETLHKIENQRNGDLLLSLSVSMQAAIYDELRFADGKSKQFIADFDKGHGHVDFQIPQSYWVSNILPQMGHDSFRLIELPTISQIIPAEYKKSLNELEEAKKYFLNGDYDKTVAHCRSALDPFKPQKGEIKKFVTSKSEFQWINDVLEATDEWLVKLVRSTSHFTSKAHHIPSIGHFDRTEAEIIMMVTVSLIAYIGKLKG